VFEQWGLQPDVCEHLQRQQHIASQATGAGLAAYLAANSKYTDDWHVLMLPCKSRNCYQLDFAFCGECVCGRVCGHIGFQGMTGVCMCRHAVGSLLVACCRWCASRVQTPPRRHGTTTMVQTTESQCFRRHRRQALELAQTAAARRRRDAGAQLRQPAPPQHHRAAPSSAAPQHSC
jgi:hypothetical protein